MDPKTSETHELTTSLKWQEKPTTRIADTVHYLINIMSVIQILPVLHFSTVDVIIICEHCEHKFTRKHTYDNHIHYGNCKINAERKLNPPSPKAM